MIDAQGRRIRYLRLSITESCSMRCTYCRPAGAVACRAPALTPGDYETLVRHLAERHGLQKVRLTGGEPTASADLFDVVARLARIAGIRELGLTTNGLTLARDARRLALAGLSRVNVSLDSLSGQTFRAMTGVDGLGRVLAGIDAALAAGLTPVKLNTVVVRGENEGQLAEILDYAAGRAEIRFIELMPMGPLAATWEKRFVPADEMKSSLSELVATWTPLAATSAPAGRFRVKLRDGRDAVVGFITAMSCNFCGACDRIRIGADGSLYPCLMDRPSGTLTHALRPKFDPDEVDRRLLAGLAGKAAEHPATGLGVMTRIGG